jgi:SAM-dependent methyltransferase
MREADIRPADLLNEYLRLSTLDAERLFPKDDAREHRDCPGCGGDKNEFQFEKNGFDLVRCEHCATLFVNPAPTEQALQALYSDSPSADYWANIFMPAVLESRRENIFKPRAKDILTLLSRLGETPLNIVDVGAGAGLLIEELQKLSPNAVISAIEPGLEQAAYLRSQCIETFEGYVSDLAEDDKLTGSADLVVCCELIEHITNTSDFLNALAKITKPNGHIVITGLSASGFDIEVLGINSNAVSPPHHLTFLSQRGIAEMVRRSGLELVAFETPGKLDIDIVHNALKKNSEIEMDSFLKNLILNSEQKTRDSFQQFLSQNTLSSHMWMVVKNTKSTMETQQTRTSI